MVLKKSQFSQNLNNVEKETDSATEALDHEAEPSDSEICKVVVPIDKLDILKKKCINAQSVISTQNAGWNKIHIWLKYATIVFQLMI